MSKKEEETQEETQEDTVLDDLREIVKNMEDGRPKMYVEFQLDDYDNAANSSQRARILSNLRAGLASRVQTDEGYRPLFDALPQRTRSKDMAKEAEYNRRLNGFLAMADENNMEFISMLNQKASEKKGIKAGTPHTAQSWAASMADKSMRDTPYQKEASQ